MDRIPTSVEVDMLWRDCCNSCAKSKIGQRKNDCDIKKIIVMQEYEASNMVRVAAKNIDVVNDKVVCKEWKQR